MTRGYTVSCDQEGCEATESQSLSESSQWQTNRVEPFNRGWRGTVVELHYCPDHAVKVPGGMVPPGDRVPPVPWVIDG